MSSVRLTPASSELGLGGTLQLKLTALDGQDNEVVGRATAWASADTAVAAVSAGGLVTARRIGIVQLQAAVDGRSAFSVVNVVAARVATVAVTPGNGTVPVGSALQITARLTDAGDAVLTDRLVFWQSSNNGVALVTSTGLVSGRSAGTATITATSEGKTATAQVTVTGVTPPPTGGTTAPAAVDSVKVEPGDTTMARNTTARFRARVYVGGRVVTDRPVTWSVTQSADGAGVLAVSATGEVSALDRANTTGNVNATAGGVAGSAKVTVVNKAAVSVVITAPAPSLEKGRSFVVSAAARDDEGTSTDETLTWESSAPSVLGITTAGVPAGSARVTALEAGSATITARTARDVRGTASIAVTNPPAPVVTTARVDVTPASRSLLAGESQQLTATAFDAAGARRDGRTFAWRSSAPGVAAVSATTGLVSAVGAGTATIIAADGAEEGSAVITVTVPPPPIVTQRVEVTPPPGPLLPGATAQLSATAYDNNNARREGRTFSWTSTNPAAATVGATTGLVTAVAPGAANIVAVADGVSGSTNVLVNPPPRAAVARVTVAPATQTLDIGQAGPALTATPFDAAGTALTGRDAPVWISSNTAVATVNGSTGVVTGVGQGTATITATIERVAGTATITVNPPRPAPVARVAVSAAPATIVAGGTSQGSAAPFDSAGRPLSGRGAPAWTTSDAAIATVNATTGVITAVAPGTATITATIETIAGSTTITVTPRPVATVTVTAAVATLDIGQATQATATASDAAGAPLPGRGPATWVSSAPGVATVSTAGVITAIAAGTATITGTIESKSGSVTITVKAPAPPPVTTTRVEVTPASATIERGATRQLEAAAFDGAGVRRTGRVFTWTSGNPAVATVNSAGLVTAVGGGTATITAADGAVTGSATITVTVPPPPATTTTVTVTPTPVSLVAGTTRQLTATARDAAGTVRTGRTFVWASSNPAVATVDAAGLVRAVAAGNATITAADGTVVGSAAVAVTPPATAMVEPPVARVLVDPATVGLLDAGNAALRERLLTARPLSATDELLTGRTCSWSGGRSADGRDRIVQITTTSVTTARVRSDEVGATLVVASCDGRSGNSVVTVRDADGAA